MNNSTTNKNIETQNQTNLDWNLIQSQMKNKLGIEIFESFQKSQYQVYFSFEIGLSSNLS
jgi:hypothetical protein